MAIVFTRLLRIIIIVSALALLTLGCTTTYSYRYTRQDLPLEPKDLTVQVGVVENYIDQRNAHSLGSYSGIALNIPVTKAVRETLEGELGHAGYELGASDLIVDVGINSLGRGWIDDFILGTSLTFRIRREADDRLIFEQTYEQSNTRFFFQNQRQLVEDVQRCVRKFIYDPSVVKVFETGEEQFSAGPINARIGSGFGRITSPPIYPESEGALNTVAVLSVRAIGVPRTTAEILAESLRDELFQSGRFILLNRSDMNEILDQQAFTLSGACTTTDCMVEAGRILAVEKIATASVSKLGNTYSVTVTMVDVNTTEIEASATERREADEDDLFGLLQWAVYKLVNQL